MITKKMYIYKQNNSYGYFENIRNYYTDKLEMLPVKMYGFDDGYTDIAVDDMEIIPKEVYFDGVAKGIDCACCGDRWISMIPSWNKPEDVFVFDTCTEFEHFENINKYDYYVILEELEKR